MSDLQAYYENFATQPSRWVDPEKEHCGCRGRGWFVSELDTTHKCPYHYVGQPDPMDDVSWEEHATRCLVGFFARAKKEAPVNPSGSGSYPEDPEDNIPF